MTANLFAGTVRQALAEGAWLLPGFALEAAARLLDGIDEVATAAPFRQFTTPGGRRMAVAMTNTGRLGWVSDRAGYRYSTTDPDSGRSWPAMPKHFAALARDAANLAGYAGFAPDVALINRYRPGTRLSLHQDIDETDFAAPIVSVSLGVTATFLFGGLDRRDRCRRMRLEHGDVLVWGGPSRKAFHGIAPLAASHHPLTGELRYNLTFRRV